MPSICQISYLVVIIEIELFLQIYYSSFSMVRKCMHSQIHTVKNHGGVDACVKEVCNLDAHKSICRFVCIYICYVYSHRTEFLNLKGSLMTKDNVFILKKQTQWANVKSKIIYSRIPYMYLPVIMILKTKLFGSLLSAYCKSSYVLDFTNK